MAINLQSLRKTGDNNKPPRIVLYGTHGVGKSTFAAQSERPVFIQTEDGLDALNTTAFPLAVKFSDVIDALASLGNEKHDFKTVVIDSADWLEKLIFKRVAEDNKVKSIDDIGYGKGYIFALDLWHEVLTALDYLRNVKEMQIMILAHTQIKRFDNPLTDSYDRYLLDMHKGGAAIISEWCDILAFSNYTVHTITNDVGFNQKKTKAIGGTNRTIHTQESPGWVAKSRWYLPEPMDMKYHVFASHLKEAMNATKSEKE